MVSKRRKWLHLSYDDDTGIVDSSYCSAIGWPLEVSEAKALQSVRGSLPSIAM